MHDNFRCLLVVQTTHNGLETIIGMSYQKVFVKFGLYRQISNIRRALIGNKIVDRSDVVAASPVGAAPTTSSFST